MSKPLTRPRVRDSLLLLTRAGLRHRGANHFDDLVSLLASCASVRQEPSQQADTEAALVDSVPFSCRDRHQHILGARHALHHLVREVPRLRSVFATVLEHANNEVFIHFRLLDFVLLHRILRSSAERELQLLCVHHVPEEHATRVLGPRPGEISVARTVIRDPQSSFKVVPVRRPCDVQCALRNSPERIGYQLLTGHRDLELLGSRVHPPYDN